MKRKSLHSDRKKKRERCRQRCGHCQQFLSHTQYHHHHHRRLYYNSSLEQWKTIEDIKRSSVPDVPGSSSSESKSKGTYNVCIARMMREQQCPLSLCKPHEASSHTCSQDFDFRLNLKLFVDMLPNLGKGVWKRHLESVLLTVTRTKTLQNLPK